MRVDNNEENEQNVSRVEKGEETNDPNTSTLRNRNIKKSEKTKRINSDPNMFFKVPIPSLNIHTSCLPPTFPLATAKKILVVNLESFLVMMITIPRIVFHTYIYVNGDICSLGDTVMLVGKVIGSTIDIFFNIMIVIVIHRKLDKFSS